MRANLDTPGIANQRMRSINWNAEATTLQTAAVCAVAALLSCCFTGFVFGVSNNQFHLPIMERLYDEPQFANDAFVQSLRYFSSGVWLILAAGPKFADGGYGIFLLLFYASRLLSLVGFMCCASLLGINSLRERLIFAAIICFTVLLDGNSFAGHGGLFLNFFSHSEIANGTILLAIFFAARGRFTTALLCAGATFLINAFMGVWVLAPLAFIALASLRAGKIELRSLFVQAVPGAIGFAVLAAPVLYNALSNPELRAPITFDYGAFLREWYGSHYLIDANSPHDVFMLLSVIGLGWLCFKALENDASELTAAFLGILAVYVIGVLVSLVTAHPAIMKLHLLRSSAVIQMLAALGAAALSTRWLCSAERTQSTFYGPVLLVCLGVSKILIPAGAVVVALAARWQPQRLPAALRPAILAGLLLVALPWQIWQQSNLNQELTAAVKDWQTVGAWARSATPPDSNFLILTTSADSLARMPAADVQRTLVLSASAAAFQAAAHRRIWVDFFNGGMVVFQPSYYDEWHSRVSAVLALRTISEKLRYARDNGVAYVIDDCTLYDAENILPAFRSGQLCAAATKS